MDASEDLDEDDQEIISLLNGKKAIILLNKSDLENKITEDILKEKLRETGFKITPQRRAVIDILLKHNSEHLSSEQIYDLVRVDCPEIGLATVYRTMQLLDEIGVISKLNLDDGCIRYEISLNKNECHNHHHLICKNCSKIIEVQEDLLESIESKIQERYKFDIVDHDVKFYGLCEDCKK